MLLSQILIGCSLIRQEYRKLCQDWFMLENNTNTTLHAHCYSTCFYQEILSVKMIDNTESLSEKLKKSSLL